MVSSLLVFFHIYLFSTSFNVMQIPLVLMIASIKIAANLGINDAGRQIWSHISVLGVLLEMSQHHLGCVQLLFSLCFYCFCLLGCFILIF